MVVAGQRLLLLGVLALVLSTLLRPDGQTYPLLDAWLYGALSLLSAGLLVTRALWVGMERAAWLALAVGVLSGTAGDIVYVAVVAGPDEPFPSVADPLYLAYYPAVYVGLVLLLRAKLRRLPVGVWLDGAAVAFALAAAAAAVAFGPISDTTGGSPQAVAVGLAYPLGDLVLLSIVAAALAVLGWRADRRWLLLAGGIALFAVADTLFLFQVAREEYVEGTWLDGLWPLASLLVARAAWQPARQLADRRLHGVAVLLPPLGCTLLATAVLLASYDMQLPRLAVLLAAATLTVVAVRLALTFREVSALSDSRRQALTDELTGLPNRRALIAGLRQAATSAGPAARWAGTTATSSAPPKLAGSGGRAGLLLVDLNRFKEINDSLGHHIGDELLRQLADRLARQTRSGDLLARLGGDEFAVLLAPGTDAATAAQIAGRLVGSLADPFPLDDVTLHVEASVGIALCPEHCADPMLLLQRADVAMYTAKNARSHIAVYRSQDDPHSRARIQTLEALRAALTRGELVCHYQPKITIADGSVRSVEALVRWEHPTRGLLAPEEFLPLAEQTGLMRPLTLAVLGQALRQARSWRDGGKPMTVAVNLSVSNLLDADLPGDVGRLLVAHDLPADALTLEITESVLMADSARAKVIVAALHDLGVGLSIDDYGTGYSSLAYLQDLAVDELKLDRVFIARLTQDPRSAAIVRSTIDLAHSLGLNLVAEGVEDTPTLDVLRRYGCDISQGYHHSRPLPADQLDSWLAARPPVAPTPRAPLRVVADTEPVHGYAGC